MATILLDGLHRLGIRGKTFEAEEGLGIDSSCYFYIFHTDQEFGYVVFMWTPNRQNWAEDDGGACPFDTGGLWHGRMVTEPALRTAEEKRAFFTRHDCPLGPAAARFWAYLQRNYAGVEATYVDGRPPAEGIAEIPKVAPNDARSWTWEVRVRRDRLQGGIELDRIVWSNEQVTSFEEWIENESAIDLPSTLKLQRIVESVSMRFDRGTAAEFATEHLKARIQNKA